MEEPEPVNLAVVMPAFNEAEGLPEFISEILASLDACEPQIIVVNDHSSDDTSGVLANLAEENSWVSFVTNSVNMGHGPSTLRALGLGLESQARVVLAVDGDGQFTGAGIRKALEVFQDLEPDILEGIRVARQEPPYRKAVTMLTRLLVWSRCGSFPKDANTPLRIYSASALSFLLPRIPADSPVPNLVVSALTRKSGLNFVQVEVQSIPRRGSDQSGSTWGRSIRTLPSGRFIRFCLQAGKSWISTPIRAQSSQ